MEHLQVVLQEKDGTGVYGLPSPCSSHIIVFKVVSLHPERRSYLQRAFALSRDDAWLSDLDPGFGFGLALRMYTYKVIVVIMICIHQKSYIFFTHMSKK